VTVVERFLSHVDTSGGPTACHPWTGGRDEDGYGLFSPTPRTTTRASRFALSLKLGRELGTDEETRHTCDNPPCCNQTHLVEGTHQQNVADREARGRTSRGERHYAARLTAEQVEQIRRLAAPGNFSELGRRFGVSGRHVSNIASGKRWSRMPVDRRSAEARS
jgi:hypothetical protein